VVEPLDAPATAPAAPRATNTRRPTRIPYVKRGAFRPKSTDEAMASATRAPVDEAARRDWSVLPGSSRQLRPKGGPLFEGLWPPLFIFGVRRPRPDCLSPGTRRSCQTGASLAHMPKLLMVSLRAACRLLLGTTFSRTTLHALVLCHAAMNSVVAGTVPSLKVPLPVMACRPSTVPNE
jgi:hypothetical protein